MFHHIPALQLESILDSNPQIQCLKLSSLPLSGIGRYDVKTMMSIGKKNMDTHRNKKHKMIPHGKNNKATKKITLIKKISSTLEKRTKSQRQQSKYIDSPITMLNMTPRLLLHSCQK